MKFVKIDGKPVELHRLEALYAAFHEHVFFKFMDGGRAGLLLAVDDIIDNYSAWIFHNGPFGREFRTIMVSDAEASYSALRNRAARLLVDGLITNGSEGVLNAIRQIYLLTLDVVIETKAQS